MFVTYQVTGTSGSDAISVSIDEANNRIISAVNGVSDVASDLINNSIQIDGLGGNDTISITETGFNTVVVNAGSGNDTINLGNGGNSLSSLLGEVTVNGDGNVDTMVLWDENSNSNEFDYFANGSSYGREFMLDLTGNVEEVVFNTRLNATGNFSCSERPTAHVTVNGHISTHSDFTVVSPGDTVTFRPDDASSTAGRASFSTTSIDFNGYEKAEFFSMSQLTIETPNANDNLTAGIGATPGARLGHERRREDDRHVCPPGRRAQAGFGDG